MKKCIIFLLMLPLVQYSLFAQNPVSKQENLFWFKGGLGGASPIGLGLDYNFTFALHKKHLFSLKSMMASEIFNKKQPANSIFDTGILYGRMYHRQYFMVSASLGISWVKSTKRGNYLYTTLGGDEDEKEVYEKLISNTIGIPAEVSFSFIPAKWIGIGMSFPVNINKSQSFTGIYWHLKFGRLR